MPPKAEFDWWYQYYFATDRGKLGYGENRYEFNKLIWKTASPKWDVDDVTTIAPAFNNPHHVSIVINNYCWRLSLVKGEAQYDALEQRLFEDPVIGVPTITIASDFECVAADGKAYTKNFFR